MSEELERAVEAKDDDQIQHIIESGSPTPATLASALAVAARTGNISAVKALVGAGAALEEPAATTGWRPIHIAVENTHLGVVKELVRLGADINASAPGGMTPLHLAVDAAADSEQQIGRMEGTEVIEALLDLGADASKMDDNGKSAYDWAREADAPTLEQLLDKNR